MRLLVVVVLELKVMEVYANGFIRPSKSPAGAPKNRADIRFASEGLTRLQTTKRVELLNGGPRDDL